MRLLLRRFHLSWIGLLLTITVHADTLRIGSWDSKTDALTQVVEAVLSKAYAELKQPVEFVDVPIRRAMQMMINRELDGNVYRIADLALEQPRLYRVETPVYASEVRVYALSPVFKPAKWTQLAGLRVAYQRGTLLIERNLPTDCIPVPASSVAEIFKMLKTGVADVSINVEPAQSPLHPLAVAASIGRLDDALERVPLHHYLLDSHRELGERLNVVLKRMQASGEIQTIRTKTLGAAK